jgi:hypothetical protein
MVHCGLPVVTTGAPRGARQATHDHHIRRRALLPCAHLLLLPRCETPHLLPAACLHATFAMPVPSCCWHVLPSRCWARMLAIWWVGWHRSRGGGSVRGAIQAAGRCMQPVQAAINRLNSTVGDEGCLPWCITGPFTRTPPSGATAACRACVLMQQAACHPHRVHYHAPAMRCVCDCPVAGLCCPSSCCAQAGGEAPGVSGGAREFVPQMLTTVADAALITLTPVCAQHLGCAAHVCALRATPLIPTPHARLTL